VFSEMMYVRNMVMKVEEYYVMYLRHCFMVVKRMPSSIF
jgi:hypothetical protein